MEIIASFLYSKRDNMLRPAVEGPVPAFVIRVHEPHVPEIGIQFRFLAGAEGVVRRSFAVPAAFVVEPAEKPMGVGADVQPEGPDAAPGENAFRITDPLKRVFAMPDTEIGLDVITFFQIGETHPGKDGDPPHVGVSAHGPQRAFRIPVHGRGPVLKHVVLPGKGGFLSLPDGQGIFLEKFAFHDVSPVPVR